MSEFRDEFQRQIIGNIIKGRCAALAEELPWMDYQDSYCSGSLVRFGTERLDQVALDKGWLKSGRNDMHSLLYAVQIDSTGLRAMVSANEKVLAPDEAAEVNLWLTAENFFGVDSVKDENGHFYWELVATNSGSLEQSEVEKAVDHFVLDIVPLFENSLLVDAEQEATAEELREGGITTVQLDRFERNPVARAECLAAQGTRCAICGFDFGEFYGDECAGMIEVHHIEPLSAIREDHVVDPAVDLIPVCPNCHWVLHSKRDEVRSPEEVRGMIRNKADH